MDKDYFNKVWKKFEEMQEQKFFKELQDNKNIEDAILIMNPKHKDIIIKSGLKCCILWSSLCPENTTYMVTDEQLKENFKRNLERNYKRCCDEKNAH